MISLFLTLRTSNLSPVELPQAEASSFLQGHTRNEESCIGPCMGWLWRKSCSGAPTPLASHACLCDRHVLTVRLFIVMETSCYNEEDIIVMIKEYQANPSMKNRAWIDCRGNGNPSSQGSSRMIVCHAPCWKNLYMAKRSLGNQASRQSSLKDAIDSVQQNLYNADGEM